MWWNRVFLCVCILVSPAHLSTTEDVAKITYTSPRHGGINGGTQLKIFGTGFDTKLNLGRTSPNVEVNLVSNFREYKCDVHEAESDENQTVCYTMKMKQDVYFVRMKINGKPLNAKSYCGGYNTHYRCRFYALHGYTPLIYQLGWVSNTPQQLINIRGRIYTNLTSSTVAVTTNGQSAAIVRVLLNYGKCQLFNESSQLPYGATLDGADGQSHWGQFKCLVESPFVGSQNISFIVNKQFGRSMPYIHLMKVSADNRLYMLQTYPVINNVTPKMGSVSGGTLLTIQGNYFDDSSTATIKVLVGGEECKVQNVTSTTITCLTPAALSNGRTKYSGGRGLRVEVFPGINDLSADLDSATKMHKLFVDNSYASYSALTKADNYFTRTRGFFVPSVDGNYIFSIHADDRFQFFFDSTGDAPQSAVMETSSYVPFKVNKTKSFALSAGKQYYFEIRHVEYNGHQYFRMGVCVDKTNYTPDQTSSAISEEQEIEISSKVEKEVQKITFQNWNEQSSVESVWSGSFSCLDTSSNCAGVTCSFSLFNAKTGQIAYDDTSFLLLENEMNSLIPLNGDKVKVKGKKENFQITFKSKRGQMELTATSSNDTKLTCSLTKSVIGQPKLDTFTFNINGHASEHVKYGASEATVADAIMGLFTPNCPRELGQGIGRSLAYFDMETEVVPSGDRISETSFCGGFSLKNPKYLYRNNDRPYNPSTYKHICFAYMGRFLDLIEVSYSYTDGNNNRVSKNLRDIWRVGLDESLEKWTHFCYNIYDRLKEDHPSSRGITITEIRLKRMDNEEDVYLDNIFVGARSWELHELESFKRRVIPPAGPHIKLESVDVIKTGDEYQITFNPLNCGFGFPLLGFAFSSEISNLPDGVQYSFGSDGSQVQVRRISTASPPVTGVFDVAFDDSDFKKISGLPANMSAETLQDALETLEQIRKVNVKRTGTCYGYTWKVTFVSPGGSYPAMKMENTDLYSEPEPSNITASVTTKGGLCLDPILGDYLRTAYDVPQVQVWINGIPSHCSAEFDDDNTTSCDFQWMSSSTPNITHVTPTSGSAGTKIQISGKSLSGNVSNIKVKIGNELCEVTSSSTTGLECTLGKSPAGNQPLSVWVSGKGLTHIPNEYKTVQITGTVTSISPNKGSANGCSTVTIKGSGFDSSATVSIGGKKCDVSEVKIDSITCQTTDGTVGSHPVKVTIPGATVTSTVEFTYIDGVGVINSVSPNTLSVKGGEIVTISGEGFGNKFGKVYVGNSLATNITSWKNTKIIINSPIVSPGRYKLRIMVKEAGCSVNSKFITYSYTVTSLTPESGSLAGGTKVTISGSGLTDTTSVKFGDVSCNDINANTDGSSLTCVTSLGSMKHNITFKDGGIEYGWEESTIHASVGDQVIFSWFVPSDVTSVKINLFTTETFSSKEFNKNGFSVPRSRFGRFTYTLPKVGTIYYASCLNEDCEKFMRGTIHVGPAESSLQQLHVFSGSVEAAYTPEPFNFNFDVDQTPRIASIKPNSGTTNTVIVIRGKGFEPSVAVKVGDKNCEIKSRSSSVIKCKISLDEELDVDTHHEVKVFVDGKGYARNEIVNALNRTFALLPLVTSVSPKIGSLAGGTKISIKGSGFTNQTEVSLSDYASCIISPEETTYSTIVCTSTAVSASLSGQVKVTTERQVSVECCEYTFSSDATPVVSQWNHNKNWTNLRLNFTGKGFGRNINHITVKVASLSSTITSICRIISVSDTEVLCEMGRFAVYKNTVSLHVTGRGYARFEVDKTLSNAALLDGIVPSSGSVNGGAKITIMGNGFIVGQTEVTIGNKPCIVLNVTLSQVVCKTPAVVPGSYKVNIRTKKKIYPNILEYEYSDAATPQVDSVSPERGSGGDTITLTGTNFGNDVGAINLTFGGKTCDVESATETTIKCKLGSREGGKVAIDLTVAEKGIATVNVSFIYNLQITTVEVSKPNRRRRAIEDDVIDPLIGSYGGGQTIVVKGEGFSDNTVITLCERECIKQVVEATQITCTTPNNDNLNQGTTSCDIKVANGENVVYSASPYLYDSSITPVINDVTPARGGTAGGTEITIIGTSLELSEEETSVTIDGSICDIKVATATMISCVTNAHKGSIKAKVDVRIGDNGIATQENADFYYIDRWSSVFTWGGTTLPKERDFVVIQKGQTVLLDTDTPVLKMLLIDGGELIFDEIDLMLNAENILITNGGLLQVGTEETPFEHKAQIVMYGNLRSPELPIYGAKTLGVRNGTLDLHGRHVMHPWTTLAATADAGATQITLQHSVDWKVGDKIVIASTGLRHSQKENEECLIAAVSADGKTLTLAQPLEYKHLGITETFNGVEVQFRAEVGLLSRNVVFRGSDNHVWHDEIPECPEGFDTGMFATQTCFQGRFGKEIGSDQFGASIMMHSQFPSSPDIRARIEGVEFTYVGQAFRLGRYPVHWHLMGNVYGQYVKRCSIHKSFNRAVTIHGTHNLTVESNVVYDIFGGAIFIEDGIETNNVIQYNLAVFVRQSTSLLNDDVTPAAYWVTNPDNIIRHNHAAGGTHFGFWYRMHEHPDGPSFTPDICQQHVELGEFRNNTVHSQGWFGLWIFQTYFPMEGGRCDSTVPSPARFYSLTTWNSEKGAEWVNCGAIQFIDFVLVNNEDTAIDTKLIKGTEWGEEKGALIKNALIVGHTDQVPKGYESKQGITLPFSPGLYVLNTVFVNFNRKGVAFGVTSITGTCTFLCGGFYYWTEGLKFVDTTKRVVWRWLHEGVIVDRDGTLTGKSAMSKVVPFSPIMNPSECIVSTGEEFSSNTKFPSAICAPSVRFHRLALNKPLPSSLEGNDLIFKTKYGNTSSTYEKKRLTHKPGWMALLQGHLEYLMYFENGEQFINVTYNSRYYDFLHDDYITVSIELKERPDVIKINDEERYSVDDAKKLTKDSSNLDWYYNQDTRLFEYRISGKKSSRKRRNLEIVDDNYTHVSAKPSVYRCYYTDCIEPLDADEIPPTREKPEDFIYWSDSHPCIEWIGNNTVVIKRSAEKTLETEAVALCWVVVNVERIEVDNITIQGVLHFENTDTFVSAIYITVLGGRLVAGFSDKEYFSNDLTIELRGDHDTPRWSLPGVDLGSKVIGCMGGCDIHGKPHNVYWTHLAKTATAGSTQLVLEDAVDWEIGDEIVITTTGYRSNETEKNKISSVSEDKKTIGLRNPLVNRHLGEEYTAGSSWRYEMKAEVGLLTRNIKVIGQRYDGIDREAYGGRILVGSVSLPDNTFIRGWARLSNVELHHTGQEGWTDPWDPRFSLAYVDTAETSNARPSFVHGCAFHDGFSTAIGTFGADKINITNNIVHRTIHDGIRITGSGHRLEGNLVTVTLSRGVFGDRTEYTNFKDWQASFQLSEAENLILNGNTAAGSERLGFHIDGEACAAENENAWTDNAAHGCLHGVHIFTGDGVGDCSKIRNFVIYKSWDYGIYHQTKTSVLVQNCSVVDSTVGYFPMIFGPNPISHEYADKFVAIENSLFVGRSPHFDPNVDFMDEKNDKNLISRRHLFNKKAPPNPTGGKTGVMLPLLQGSPNGAPFKPYHVNNQYPLLNGFLNITGLHAHSYNLHSDGTRDLVFYNNPLNEDANFPTHLRQVTLTDVARESKVFLDRPSLGKVNPSDCVDMECDGKKIILIKDFDGGFLGRPGAVISQAEFGWDDDAETSRGLGDYRIPKTLLSTTSGDRIPVEDIIDHRGIIRNDACTYFAPWQAYDCQGPKTLDYAMLVIESMDSDSETRRLSPVAILGDGYIDLVNGPSDHGWCFGYTCQLRISTFYTIIATGKSFEVFFTGVTPQSLRLHLLNVDSSKTVRVAIWYSRPERLDVYNVETNRLIRPENAYKKEGTDTWGLTPVTLENQNSFYPPVDAGVNGANFFDRATKQLYITIRGNVPIEIRTAPAIFLSFAVPSISVDDFFGEKLVSNLATFLGVPPENIRIVEIVRESSSRKRRDTNQGKTDIKIMISSPAETTSNATTSNTTMSNVTEPVLSSQELNEKAVQVAEVFQAGNISAALKITVLSFSSTKSVENRTEEFATVPEVQNDLVEYKIPNEIVVMLESTATEIFSDEVLTIILKDIDGDIVPEIAGKWMTKISIDNYVGEYDMHFDEVLEEFSNGAVNFSLDQIIYPGTYTLLVEVLRPNGETFDVKSTTLERLIPAIRPIVSDESLKTFDNDTACINYAIELRNDAGEILQDMNWKGFEWFVSASFDDKQSLSSFALPAKFPFDMTTGKVSTPDLCLWKIIEDVSYTINLKVYTEPELYDITLTTQLIVWSKSNDTSDNSSNSTNNETSLPNNTTMPEDLICPEYDESSKMYKKLTWLCEYIRWKVTFVTTWLEPFNEWREMNMEEKPWMEHHAPRPKCTSSNVTCSEAGSRREMKDADGCWIAFCVDGRYKPSPDFNKWMDEWMKDMRFWRKIYGEWEKWFNHYKKKYRQIGGL